MLLASLAMLDGISAGLTDWLDSQLTRATREVAGCLASLDYDAGVRVYQEAAARGDAVAMRVLGMVEYRQGSHLAAREWLVRAVEHADTPDCTALNNLAIMLAEGLGGPCDIGRARRLLARAASQGSLAAQLNYACLLYMEGSMGLARQQFARAAETYDDPIAQANLANMLLRARCRRDRTSVACPSPCSDASELIGRCDIPSTLARTRRRRGRRGRSQPRVVA